MTTKRTTKTKTEAQKEKEAADALLKEAFGEYPTYRAAWGNCLPALLLGVQRDQLTEPPPLFVFTNYSDRPTKKVGCSLLAEQISIILQGKSPLVHTPRPHSRFDRDLDRVLLEFPDNKVVVVDRPDPKHTRNLATAWRDPHFIHQPLYRKPVTAQTLAMDERIIIATGPMVERYTQQEGVTHNVQVVQLFDTRYVFYQDEWVEVKLPREEWTKNRWGGWENEGWRQRNVWMLEGDTRHDKDGKEIGTVPVTPYSRSRKQLLDWTLANRDALIAAAQVLIKNGWLEKNGYGEYLH